MNFIIEYVNYYELGKLNLVLDQLAFLRNVYPHFVQWFQQKVVPGLKLKQRSIYIVTPANDSNCIAGVLILKKEVTEKKICTLCILPQYQKQGLGTILFQRAIQELQTPHPLITISSLYMSEYDSLLKKFNFSLWAKYQDYYKKGSVEYSYNAPIEYAEAGFVVNG